MQALKAGESVALMNDQKMNDGIAAPFFGRMAMTAPGPARMALRYDCPLVPMSIRRKDRTRFKVTIHEPLARPEGKDADAILEVVTTINRFMEERIKEAPSQWFWVHRRFEKPLYKQAKAKENESSLIVNNSPSLCIGCFLFASYAYLVKLLPTLIIIYSYLEYY